MGYVYFLTNTRMPGLVKIGRTISLVDRLRAINCATGVPGRFTIDHSIEVDDEVDFERQMHKALAPFRLSNQKEFFEIPLKYAVKIANSLASETATSRRSVPLRTALLHDSASQIGAAIRAARKDLGLSQAEVAVMSNCGRRVVVEVEAGKPTTEIGLVMRICRVVGFSLATVRV